MTVLSNLIQKINIFYKNASNSYFKALAAPGFYMPDDEEEPESIGTNDLGLFNKIETAAREISNSDILSEVLLIAELYKKAVSLGSGFNLVNKAVSNLVNMLDDEDDEEQMAVEDLMNEISRDLRARAKNTPLGDSDAAVKELQNVKNTFNSQMISEDLEGDEPTAYEAGLSQYQEGAESVFDPTGGVSQEVGKAKGRGYYVTSRSYKDWVQSYQNELQRYKYELTAPELQLSRTGIEARKNTATRQNMAEIISVLQKMIEATKKANQLESELQGVSDPDKQKELDNVREELRSLQADRTRIKAKLRKHQYEQEIKSLNQELGNARTPNEKMLIQERIKLIELTMSSDRGKDEEKKWRRLLIESISGGNSLPAEQISKIQQKIQEGASKRVKHTLLYRQKAEQVAALKGTQGPINTKQERLEGGTKRNVYNFDAIALDGLVEHLTQRLATERVVVKQKVTDKLKKAQKDPAQLKPFMDDLAKAATKKDKNGLMIAARNLRNKMEEFKNVQPELVGYVISLRTSKFFYNFRDKVKQIGKWIDSPITADKMSFINDTIREGRKLSEYYKSLKIKPITPGWPEKSTHYKPPTEIIDKILQNLEGLKNGS